MYVYHMFSTKMDDSHKKIIINMHMLIYFEGKNPLKAWSSQED